MSSYTQTARLREAYAAAQQKYREVPGEALRYPLFSSEPDAYPPHLRQDLEELAGDVQEDPARSGASWADQVFGQQVAQTRILGKHLGRVLKERWMLYQEHLDNIQYWVSTVKNELNFARRPYSRAPPQLAASLERLLLQLEADRRDEQLAFWKDSSEIRQKMLEAAFEYRAARHRANLLQPPEEGHGG